MPLPENERASLKGFIAVYAVLGIFFGWYASLELKRHPILPTETVAIYVCFVLLLGFYLAPGFHACRSWLIRRLSGRRTAVACAVAFLVPWLIYAAGTGDFRWFVLMRLLAIAIVPFLLCAVPPNRNLPQKLTWQDVTVLLWLIVPVLAGQIGGIWNVPVNLDFMARLFLVGVGAWSFLIFRRIEGSGYEFGISSTTLKDAAKNFGGFAAIGLPLGFAMHFIGWNPQWRGLPAFVSDWLVIFLFIAITEELFFRGLLQNLLEGSFRSRYAAQALTSVLFGLSHIRHAPFPNWRYVAIATIAGWFYGSAYRSHRSVMASAITHALVDTLWRTFLTLPR